MSESTSQCPVSKPAMDRPSAPAMVNKIGAPLSSNQAISKQIHCAKSVFDLNLIVTTFQSWSGPKAHKKAQWMKKAEKRLAELTAQTGVTTSASESQLKSSGPLLVMLQQRD